MNNQTKILAALIVEDMESDAQLLVRMLKKAGYELVYEQVETAGQMRAALEKRSWDIVVSDYSLPQFSGEGALAILKESELDIPFIVVSGTMGEETAVAMMKAGAHDYLTKGDLGRLVPAVERELEQAEIRGKRRQAEKALAASEAELRALFASMRDVVLVIDRQGVYRKIAPTNHDLLVKPPEELLGKNLMDVFPAEQTDFFIDTIWQVLDTKQTAQIEYELLIGGRTIWFETFISPMDEDSTLWVARDATERRQAEEALRESEERYRSLFDRMLDGMYRSTHAGKFVNVNSAMVKMFGYSSKEEMLKVDIKKELYFKPEERGSHILDTGQQEIEVYRMRRKNGSEIWVEDRGYYVHDEQGEIIFHEGMIRDVTERKQAEQALATSEAKLRALVEQIPAIAYTESAETRETLYISPQVEKLTGYMPAEWIGERYLWKKMVHPEDLAAVVAEDERTTVTHQPFRIEYRILTRDGRTLWVYDESVLIKNQDGTPLFWQGLMYDITERKWAEENIRQRVKELEMLYQSGLALGQLLNPKEIGQKILELLKVKLGWHNTSICLYNPQDESLKLLDFNQPGLESEAEKRMIEERFNMTIASSGDGLTGWALQQSRAIRSDDVTSDPHYIETYPGIRSGLYVPMKLGDRKIGVIGVESEQPNAFSEADERLIVTLANQAASAFENARLFEETHQRMMELETLNRISLALRSVSKQNEMLSIVLDEALAILNTSHGSISLYNRITGNLEKTITRGWYAQLIEPPQSIHEGIAGKVFTSGEIHISREFASDPETLAVSRSQMPPNWGGVCLPIRTTQQTLGVMNVSIPSEREFNKDEVRLLSILSEMTGAALQRMQLHEQTVHRLKQLNALRAVDQAISSSRDMHLTLNILLTHTISQLSVNAADVLLFHPRSNKLELVAGQGFHTLLAESTSLGDSFAWRAIVEHHSVMALGFEDSTLRENPQIAKLWKEEGFVCYWCVPLIVKGEAKGVLEVYCRKAFTPDVEWVEFLEALAGQAAIAIDNTQLFENLQRANMELSLAYDATIEGWSRALDLRDHETEGHTLRVTDLTIKLARAMRVGESQLTAIRRGALLHDIGKMGVPDAILLKEGNLTDEEWAVMHKHPLFARDMLMPIGYLNDALDIPYCHHEKWDGTGYPQGLKGDHIPLPARIFAVVDVWDALTNDRSYRKKWTKQKARQYLKEQSSKHFDPQVVDIFLKNIGKSWIDTIS